MHENRLLNTLNKIMKKSWRDEDYKAETTTEPTTNDRNIPERQMC